MTYFGTDGIRDRVNGPLLAPDFLYFLGRAIGRWVVNQSDGHASPHVLVGRDTRASGVDIFHELSKGLSREGVKVFDGGVCPTPAVAFATRSLDLDAGVVITASHNPASDNGIKIFGRGGSKLSVETECWLEEILERMIAEGRERSPMPSIMQYDTRRHYVDFCSAILGPKSLFGLRIVLDSANGATCRTSADVLEHYGASVIRIGNFPDGNNINFGCGSEHPDLLGKAVVRNGADLGIAHDGDGDRLILCDRHGKVVDGDAVMAILGCGWARRNALPGNTVVATVMSNVGLDKALASAGVHLERVDVGDRNVYHAMVAGGYHLGGESSGHFIAIPYLPTGDGLLAALLVLREMVDTATALDRLAAVFQPFPQRRANIAVADKRALAQLPGLSEELAALEAELGARGRILLRYSGTEPKIRLLVEAEDSELADAGFARLEAIVRKHLAVL